MIPVITKKKYHVADVKKADITKKADIFMDELNKYIDDHQTLHDHLSWYVLEHRKDHVRIDRILNIIRWTFYLLIAYLFLIRFF